MATTFPLPPKWEKRGWKLKIRDRERVEPPHVTLLHKTDSWRFGLREKSFLDRKPDPNRVPGDLLTYLLNHYEDYVEAWNAMYPYNTV
jgi:hypothetical protein